MKSNIEKLRDKFNRRMGKEKSIERAVVILLKPRHRWETGLSIESLLKMIIKEKKSTYGKDRIYEAISLINRFGQPWKIYIISQNGWYEQDGERKHEYRYFTPEEPQDIVREKDKLEDKKDIIGLKENHLEHYEHVDLPQEAKLEEIHASLELSGRR